MQAVTIYDEVRAGCPKLGHTTLCNLFWSIFPGPAAGREDRGGEDEENGDEGVQHGDQDHYLVPVPDDQKNFECTKTIFP